MINELARAGLTTIGHLYQQKSAELARRFGLRLTQQLGAASGLAPVPRHSEGGRSDLCRARMTLPEPIGFLEDLENVLKRLAAQVCGRLDTDQTWCPAISTDRALRRYR